MRLIDVDETLRLMGYEEEMYQYEENYGYRQAEKFIAKQPEVKAIPTEWIEKEIEKALSADSVDMFYTSHLKYLIKKWEKENEDE